MIHYSHQLVILVPLSLRLRNNIETDNKKVGHGHLKSLVCNTDFPYKVKLLLIHNHTSCRICLLLLQRRSVQLSSTMKTRKFGLSTELIM